MERRGTGAQSTKTRPLGPIAGTLVRVLAPAAVLLALVGSAIAADPANSATARTVEEIDVKQGADGTVVRIWTDGDLEDITYARVSEPIRLVIDFPQLAHGLESDRMEVGSEQLERIRVGVHPDRLRVVLDAGASGELASARVIRGQQGIGIVIGSGAAPELARSPYARASEKPRAASRATGSSGGPSTHAEPSTDELLSASRELASAARELTAALRELRTVRNDPPARSLESTAPPRASTPAITAAVRESRAAPREPQAPARPARIEPPETTSQDSSSASTSISPPPSPDGGWSYAGFQDWLQQHANAQPAFPLGSVLGAADVDKLRPFLPPGYWEEFQFPSVEVEVSATGDYQPHESFKAATLQYGGQTQLGDDRSLQNYVAGRPFPMDRVEGASAADRAYMIAWNMVRRWQHTGYRTKGVHMAYISPGERAGRNAAVDKVLQGGGNVERHLEQFYQRVYLSHLATLPEDGYALPVSDAKTHYYKDFMEFTDPFDMRGSMFVIERSLDPYERDQVNSYLPTERRIRRLSPKERADRFAGSEFTLDDFEGFSGRVLDYDWTLLGEKTVLQVADANNPMAKMFGPGSRVPNERWELRPTWVVELRPHLENHPYGRKILFVDKQTYNSGTAVIFDQDDRLLKILNVMFAWPYEGPAPAGAPPAKTVPHWFCSSAINKQSDIATITWAEETDIPQVTASTVRRLFSVSNLTGGR